MTRRGKWLAVIACAVTPAVAAGVWHGRGKGTTMAISEAAIPPIAPLPDADTVKGLRFRLSEGKPLTGEGEGGEAVPQGQTTPLSDADADRVLARLQPLHAEADDAQGFALRESSLPPPRAGQTVSTAFPPAPTEGTPPKVETGPLTVRRVTPEGEVPLTDRVSVTFSQPMIPVTSQDEAAANVPVTLTPNVPGKWRWLGTQTLIFDAGSGKRLPMATTFKLAVPAGTKSATGGVLAADRTVTFQTPAVRLLTHTPYESDPQGRTPLIRLGFDQKVDPDAVLKTVKLEAGGKAYAVRLATSEELATADKTNPPYYGDDEDEKATADRRLALKPIDPLPLGTQVRVTVGPGTPSLEGPRTTGEGQNFAFSTYSALQLTSTYGDNEPPGYGWSLQFNNPLDEETFDPSMVTIVPALPGARITASGNVISISGAAKARNRYRVTVAASLRDTFGQTLSKAETRYFKVGAATPYVQGPGQTFVVCDPSAKPRAAFQSINTPAVRVKLYVVGPGDWSAYLQYRNNYGQKVSMPGRLVSDTTVKLPTSIDTWGENSVDVGAALPGGHGNVIVQWESTIKRKDEAPDQGTVWMQATHLGLMAERDTTDLYAWVTNLADGKPASGANVELISTKRAGTVANAASGADGLARLTLSTQPAGLLVARRGSDVAFLPSSQWSWNEEAWIKQSQSDTQRWFIFDDRRLYRPGETAHLKGWIRTQKAGKTGDLTLPTSITSVSWTLTDSRGNSVAKGTTPVNAWAGFNFPVDLPKTMNLGSATVTIDGVGHQIDVQEFRRPEFEVTAKNEGAGPFVVGEAKGADLSATAKYYAGGALPGTDVTWTVTATATTYTPPGHEGFTFGKWTPWWGGGVSDDEGGGIRYYRGYRPYGNRAVDATKRLQGRTSGDGTHRLHLQFDGVHPAQPYAVSAQAVIQDINRQTLAANASLIVHPSAVYVGLKSNDLFVEQGKKLTVGALVCDIDGKVDAGKTISFRASRKEWGYKKGKWSQSETDVKEWAERSSGDSITTDFTPAKGGQWTVKATVRDDRERPNESELTLWVSGGDSSISQPKDKQRTLTGETVTLIPSQKEYRAGETASVLVQSPFANAEGLASVVHDGIVTIQHFTMKGSTYTLHVPIADAFLPGVGLQVELVGSAARTDDAGKPIPGVPPRPAYASGHLDLSVPPTARKLTVTAVPAEAALSPGGKTTVAVTVKDAEGKPVPNAEATVVVVDESVLALGGWNLGDPLAAFYPGRGTSVETNHLRQFVVLEDPALILGPNSGAHDSTRLTDGLRDKDEAGIVTLSAAAPGGAIGGGGFGGRARGAAQGQGYFFRSAAALPAPMMAKAMSPELPASSPVDNTPITLRSNFDALAAFVPSVTTDANGVATVPITLPDNLTRYRIVVVAVAGAKQVGHGEAALTARLPLMARPSAPRFLNFGDRFSLPVVLQNQTDDAMTVDVAVRGSNLAFPEAHGVRVQVPANNRVEVRFPAASLLPGTARFQIAATSGDRSDAAELSLPVWTPATTEAFATYGVVDNGAVVQPVKAPANVVPRFGGLEVTTTSTALQELTDALIYLEQYPYDCAEQVSSRILANAALKDVLTAFKASELPKPAAIEAGMDRDFARLTQIQQDDGGFGFWTRDSKPYPYIGVHVAHSLVLARLKGYKVPDTLYSRSLDYLKHINEKFDNDYGPYERRTIRAYALYVRHLAGDTDAAGARKLLGEAKLDELGPEVVGWLLSVLPGDATMAPARTWIDNHATETAGAAHYTFSYTDSSYLTLNSNRRADAIVLDALIVDQPKSDLIPKLVRGLLDGRVRGHWSGTQEDAFILLALDHYFRVFEGTTPDFTARLWLGKLAAGEAQFHGRTTDRIATNIPMAYLTQTPGVQNLTIDKQGAGRLYYRVGMRYAPTDLNLKPADYGFSVKRVYEAIDKPGDVRHDADGTWVIRAGAKVRVRLTMVATTRRYHVALTDPLPAGFESLNSELNGTETVDRSTNRNGNNYWWWGNWWDHENLRDERAEAFTALLWEGAYEYVYVCRATTPGNFVVPPAKAEEMYSPETFGRSGSDRVRVE